MRRGHIIPTYSPSPPPPPTGLAANATSSSTIQLTWNLGTDPGGPGVRDYGVYQTGVGNLTYVPAPTFGVTGLLPSTAYTFSVTARDLNLHEGGNSPLAGATTLAGGGGGGACNPATATLATFTAAGDHFAFVQSATNPKFVIQYDDWGPMPGGYTMQINDYNCWQATLFTRTTEQGSVACYPDVTRGWSFNGNVMALAPGNTWTTVTGMGVQLSSLTACQMIWNIQQTPTVPTKSRWDALIDIYIFGTQTPPFTATPLHDISIFQMVMDANYYGPTYTSEHGFVKTISNVKYAIIVDESDGFGVFSTGHYILMLCAPTAPTDGLAANSLWGKNNVTHDVAAILAYLQLSNPTDDNGNPVKNGHTGVTITSPLIAPTTFLCAINYGFEVDFVQSTADAFITGLGTNILVGNEVSTLTHGQPFTITGSGFGTKSRGIAPILRDKATVAAGSVDGQWDSFAGNGTGADIPYNMKMQVASFSPTGAAIGTPHPFVSGFYGGAHNITNFPYSVYLAKKLNIPTGAFVLYAAGYKRGDPNNTFGIGPEVNNLKFISYNDAPGLNINSVFAANPSQPSNNSGATFQVLLQDNHNGASGAISIANPDANGHNDFWGQALNPYNPANGWIFFEYEIFVTSDPTLGGGGYWHYRENGGANIIGYAGITDGIAAKTGNTTFRWLSLGEPFAGNYPSANNWVYLDDLYIDMTAGSIAPGSQVAKVLLKDSAGNVYPQDIVSWSDTSITINVWKADCVSGAASLVVQTEAGTSQTFSGKTLA